MVWGVPGKTKGDLPPAAARGRVNQRAPRRGDQQANEKHEMREKQAQLEQLTRAAEDNTRILERERAALVALQVQSGEHVSSINNNAGQPIAQQEQQQQQGSYQQPWQQQRQVQAPAGEQPAGGASAAGGGRNRNHNALADGHRRRVDVTQVPGLAGTFPRPTGDGGDDQWPIDELNSTFPSSPGYKVGMVIRVPGAGGNDAPSLGSPRHEGLQRSFGRAAAPGALPGNAPHDGRRTGQAQYGSPQQWHQQPVLAQHGVQAPHLQQQPPVVALHGAQGHHMQQQQPMPMDERQLRILKQNQYRAELEEQIRIKRGAQEAHEGGRRRDEEMWVQQQRAIQRQDDSSWGQHAAGPRSPAGRPGYGGPHSPSGYRSPRGPGHHLPPRSPGASHFDPPPPFRLLPPSLLLPGSDVHLANPHVGEVEQGEQMRYLNAMMQGPGGYAAAGSGSPQAQQRMNAPRNDLRAGPTDEQRTNAENQRRQLQADLQEQIRQKKARQNAERAEEELARQREDAELARHHAQLAAQRDEEVRQQRARLLGDNSPAQAVGVAGGTAPAARLPDQPGHGRRKKQLIDASWLDAPAPAGGEGQARPHASHEPSTCVAGTPDARNNSWVDPSWSPDQDTPASDHAAGAVGGEVGSLLGQMHREQVRLREEFARQASAMEQLAAEAAKAASERDRAWSELHRARAVLASTSQAGSLEGRGSRARCWSAGDASKVQLRVETHLIPKAMNAIPDALPNPLEQSFLDDGVDGAEAEASCADSLENGSTVLPPIQGTLMRGRSSVLGSKDSGRLPPLTPTRAGQPLKANRFGYLADTPERSSLSAESLLSSRSRRPLSSPSASTHWEQLPASLRVSSASNSVGGDHRLSSTMAGANM